MRLCGERGTDAPEPEAMETGWVSIFMVDRVQDGGVAALRDDEEDDDGDDGEREESEKRVAFEV